MTMQSELVFTDPMLNVVIAEVKRFNCPLLFVKDHGVYVMAAKGEKNSNGMHNVCYANGFNPDTTDFDELWDRMRDACGGDDFCDYGTEHLKASRIFWPVRKTVTTVFIIGSRLYLSAGKGSVLIRRLAPLKLTGGRLKQLLKRCKS